MQDTELSGQQSDVSFDLMMLNANATLEKSTIIKITGMSADEQKEDRNETKNDFQLTSKQKCYAWVVCVILMLDTVS